MYETPNNKTPMEVDMKVKQRSYCSINEGTRPLENLSCVSAFFQGCAPVAVNRYVMGLSTKRIAPMEDMTSGSNCGATVPVRRQMVYILPNLPEAEPLLLSGVNAVSPLEKLLLSM